MMDKKYFLSIIYKLQAKNSDKSKFSHKKFVTGFTMTEVIVAVLIVAILSGGVFSAFWSAQYFLNRARHKMQAYNFAVEALDRLRANYQYASSPAMDIGVNHAQTEIEIAGILRGELTSFSGTLTYDVTEPQLDAYKEVTIKVNWDEHR